MSFWAIGCVMPYGWQYLQVLFVLGLENDFLLLAKDDVLGRKIQDIGVVVKKCAPKEKKQ